jgi:hypothetical protein
MTKYRAGFFPISILKAINGLENENLPIKQKTLLREVVLNTCGDHSVGKNKLKIPC